MIGQFRWPSSRTHLLGWNVDRNQNTNFVWSCQSHTFTHCWDGMSNGSTFVSTHCWANNVCQFDPSLTKVIHEKHEEGVSSPPPPPPLGMGRVKVQFRFQFSKTIVTIQMIIELTFFMQHTGSRICYSSLAFWQILGGIVTWFDFLSVVISEVSFFTGRGGGGYRKLGESGTFS